MRWGVLGVLNGVDVEFGDEGWVGFAIGRFKGFKGFKGLKGLKGLLEALIKIWFGF